jgi:hypothetical protein
MKAIINLAVLALIGAVTIEKKARGDIDPLAPEDLTTANGNKTALAQQADDDDDSSVYYGDQVIH